MYKPIILDYNELSPYLSKNTIYYHYQIYLNNLNILNNLLKQANYDYKYNKRELIKNIDIFNLDIRGEILYYLSSILNHELYFGSISNKKNNIPLGRLKNDLDKYFGDYNTFKKNFINTALNLKGSGYTYLVKDKEGKLRIINTSNEDNPIYYGFTPIFNIDLWEHAYYLDYKNKIDYLNNFFNIIDYKKIIYP